MNMLSDCYCKTVHLQWGAFCRQSLLCLHLPLNLLSLPCVSGWTVPTRILGRSSACLSWILRAGQVKETWKREKNGQVLPSRHCKEEDERENPWNYLRNIDWINQKEAFLRADSNCEHLWVKHDLPWTPSPHWILSRRLLASALALVLSCVTANTTHCDWFAGCFDGLVIIEEMYLCGNKSSPCCVFCKKTALFHNQCCADRLLPLLWVQKADQWASCQNRSVMLDHPEIKQH